MAEQSSRLAGALTSRRPPDGRRPQAPEELRVRVRESPLGDDELAEVVLEWIRDRFERWPIEGLHLDARHLADTFRVSRKRADHAIRSLRRRGQIEPVARTDEEVAAGVPFLHRLVE